MKLTKAEYEELIRKKPSLRPTEVIKSQNTHQQHFQEGAREMVKYYENLNSKEQEEFHAKLALNSPWIPVLMASKENFLKKSTLVPIVQEKPVKSPRTLKFTIPGQPVGKPRQTQSDRWKKRPCVMRYRAWADKARAAVPNGVSLGIYRQISFIAYLELPKSYSKAKRELLTGQPHLQKPDIDNIAKSVGDSLFPDDKVIWKFSGEKRWQDSFGARIEVELR